MGKPSAGDYAFFDKLTSSSWVDGDQKVDHGKVTYQKVADDYYADIIMNLNEDGATHLLEAG